MELNPAYNGGYDPFTIEGDQYFTRRAIQSIRAEPAVYIAYSLEESRVFVVREPGSRVGVPGFV